MSVFRRLFILSWQVIATLLLVLSTAQAGFFDQKKEGPLPVEEAFIFMPELGVDGKVTLHWQIPEDYYLYRDRIEITPPKNIQVAELKHGPTDTKDDPLFGSVQVYHHNAEVALQTISTTGKVENGALQVSYQGCWDKGICYPPVQKTIQLIDVPAQKMQIASATNTANTANTENKAKVAELPVSEQDQFTRILSQGNWLLILGGFFLAGLALSFTPCVFPMIPIISSIIIGHGHKITTSRALLLSLIYVLAVSVTYTLAGVLAGLFGENLQAAFQNVWVIGFFSLIFVALALSMFGFYDLQVPSKLQSRLNEVSNHQQGGTVAGVAIMGLLSALIVGPCMAAPLAGALIYIGQTGDPILGGVALFMLSLGMGVPILLVGTSAGKLLPKAGLWMDAIKAAFGVLLLLMAIWMLDRVVPTYITIFLTSVVLILAAVYMKALDQLPADARGWNKLWKGVGLLILLYGVALFIGLMSGAQSFVYPLKGLASSSSQNASLQLAATQSGSSQSKAFKENFVTVDSLSALESVLAQAKNNNQAVMLDFYADWCVACKELEYSTFADAKVQQALAEFVKVKVDITANDQAAKALTKAYAVVGPPALIFYDATGVLQKNFNLVGFIDAERFVKHLQAFKAAF